MTTSRPLRLLVAEGNPPAMRERHAAKSGQTPSVFYAAVLSELAATLRLDAKIDICFPGDPGANLPSGEDLAGYDGVAITGSGLNLWKAEPESLAQVEFARAVYAAGAPFFGSCWGLQVAAVAAGGEVKLNPQGREIGIARSIRLTAEGLMHPMHEGRREVFDAPAIHSDEVAVLPDGATLTATNELCAVQAAEIRFGDGVFWGVQFHPEYTFTELGGILTRYTPIMLQEGFFRDDQEAARYIADLVALDAEPDRKDLAWRLGIAPSVLDPLVRRAELVNWLKNQVLPTASARGRA
ncbi:type 1 glutamine amidotransferase [Methylopila sp. M107]|uniref:type 1 glutamine amidotransferase n=1 Tax=Methylopila sp. M107 TaxID=1101190 RepID=UPI000377A068|nr:type 1 glutamine amidotransferase [Methylopila sp. M107]